MNLDLLPLSAFALESLRGADRMMAEPHTLTLRLTRLKLDCAQLPPVHGSVSIQECMPQAEGVLRAAVVPADGPGLTITF